MLWFDSGGKSLFCGEPQEMIFPAAGWPICYFSKVRISNRGWFLCHPRWIWSSPVVWLKKRCAPSTTQVLTMVLQLVWWRQKKACLNHSGIYCCLLKHVIKSLMCCNPCAWWWHDPTSNLWSFRSEITVSDANRVKSFCWCLSSYSPIRRVCLLRQLTCFGACTMDFSA